MVVGLVVKEVEVVLGCVSGSEGGGGRCGGSGGRELKNHDDGLVDDDRK